MSSSASKKHIKVAIAIIENFKNQVYITTRLEGKDFAQALEFPGGKIEGDESPLEAVIREVKEEINIDLVSPKLKDNFSWQHENKTIELFVFHEIIHDQQPICLEDQMGAWHNIETLDTYRFIPSSVQIIKKLQNREYLD